MGITVAVTGCSSNFGKGLIEMLNNYDDITQIKGLDVTKPQFQLSKFEFFQGDIRDPDILTQCFDGCDIVIHMAFLVFTVPESKEVAIDININGSKNALLIAKKLHIPKFIYFSSVASYGHHKRNVGKEPLKEDDGLLGEQHNHFYFYTKSKVENYIKQFRKDNPEMVITSIRPHVIIGPSFYGTINLAALSNYFKNGKFTHVNSKNVDQPYTQYTDEEDLLGFIKIAIEKDLNEAFNIAGDPILYRKYVEDREMEFSTVPYLLARIITKLTYWFGSTSELQDYWFPTFKNSILVDNSKAKEYLPSMKSTDKILDNYREYLNSEQK